MSLRTRIASLTFALTTAVAAPAAAQMAPNQTAPNRLMPALIKPPVVETFEGTLPRLSSGAQCRINALRKSMRVQLANLQPGASPASVSNAAIQNMGVMPPGGDVAEMAFIVLMQATNDQDKDLQQIMAETKAQTNAKQALRDLIAKTGRDVASNNAFDVSDADALERVVAKLPPGPCIVAVSDVGKANAISQNALFHARSLSIRNKLAPSIAVTLAGISRDAAAIPPGTDVTTFVSSRVHGQHPNATPAQINYLTFVALQDTLQSQLDSMNDMSEMSQMRLQMMMDQRSKLVEALSNIMKKIDSTQETIVQNLKG